MKRSILAIALLGLAAPALASDPPRKAPARPVEVLEKPWPDHPEWVAMFVDIVDGNHLGPQFHDSR